MTRSATSLPTQAAGRVRAFALAAAAVCATLAACLPLAEATTLNDLPISGGAGVPGNLALALSVEFPTANSVANLGSYLDTQTYLGYFDPQKCYNYVFNGVTPTASYFQPAAFVNSAGGGHACSGQWSGNFMNWSTMQTIDPFRWALSGGYRSVDSTSQTIVEKAWGSGQGGQSNFPDRGIPVSSPNNVPLAVLSKVTPFTDPTWNGYISRIAGNGNAMVISGAGLAYTTAGNDLSSLSTANTPAGALVGYRLYIRVRVCDPTTSMGTAGLETNCVKYGNNYKPEGLLQKYSSKIRYGALAYLNGSGHVRQGGVLREPMGFIGPTVPTPNSTVVTTNPRGEWDPVTGIMTVNPDTITAAASGVLQSGVMNYLNKFGESAQSYMIYDNVSELYYAALRYFENLGNVPEWTAGASITELDGFPAVTTWTDPIAYSCQKNFILGIGDDHTHTDYNVGGGTASDNRPKPSAVSADGVNQAATWTTNLQNLEGISPTPWWEGDDATYYIAGLAYGAHTMNLRPDITASLPQPATPVTISTYWMDVEEYGYPEDLNPYYLATKYGGFTIPPAGYTMPAPLTQSSWDPSGTTIQMNPSQSQTRLQPANYFLAGSADKMVAGLTAAFSNIANSLGSYSTAFSLSTATVAASGTTSFSSQFNPTGWSGTVTASTLTFSADGTPSTSTLWTSDTTLQAQLTGAGWNTGRNVATWSGTAGVAFRGGLLTSAQQTALTPSSYSTVNYVDYVSYLRGDPTNEVGSTVNGANPTLRSRLLKLGDIVNAKLTPNGAPNFNFSDSTNAGYSAFKAAHASRATMVYAGANDGMLHAFVGSSGTEQFAYVPSAAITGPSGTPQVDGLAQLGNPQYSHHFYVDATPLAFDVDFDHAGGTVVAGSDWHTLLIGGLGKGGKSFYALDVTDPTSINSDAAAAASVKWEFTDPTAGVMGFSYGAPVVVKTAKYGWVVALTSGYNSSSVYGYLYLVNPTNGALLEKIATPLASNGLTQAAAYVKDYTDYTADSIYVGDLNGQLWRFDLRGTAAYPAPTLLATVTDGLGVAQPITTAPLIEIHPGSRKRFIMFGTGQLLANVDLTTTGTQTFYAILDGNAAAFNAVATPITRAFLTQETDVTAGITLSATSKGWYFDLTAAAAGAGSRVILSPVAYNGIVSFATLQPSTDPCSASSSLIYALDYSSGTTVLGVNQTSLPSGFQMAANYAYVKSSSAVTDLRFAYVNGAPEILAGNNTSPTPAKIYAKSKNPPPTRLLNWREIPTAD